MPPCRVSRLKRERRARQDVAAAEAGPEPSAAAQAAVGARHRAQRRRHRLSYAAGAPSPPSRTTPAAPAGRPPSGLCMAAPFPPPMPPNRSRKLSAKSRSAPRPKLTAREAAREARSPGRLDPLLHLLDHVHGRSPAEPRHQRHRQRVVVLDPARGLAVAQRAARGVRQRQRQRLFPLVVIVIDNGHLDGPSTTRPAANESVPLADV